jgi:hypothetical protein
VTLATKHTIQKCILQLASNEMRRSTQIVEIAGFVILVRAIDIGHLYHTLFVHQSVYIRVRIVNDYIFISHTAGLLHGQILILSLLKYCSVNYILQDQ